MEGYAKTALLMATYEEFAIFRRFKQLNYQDLLYQQAEITYLQDCISHLAHRDAAHPERVTYPRFWWRLAHGKDREGREQWKKWKRLRKKLHKYNDTLYRLAFLAKLKGPNNQDLSFLRRWFDRSTMGSIPIRGLDRAAWDDKDDLVALHRRSTPDALSWFFRNLVFPLFHHLYGKRFKGSQQQQHKFYRDPESPELGDGIYQYRESRLVMIVNLVVTVVAALLPLLSTTVLFLLQTNAQKLGGIVAFSACFALALALMTNNTRRIEVFTATAASVTPVL
ncbi:hypothetical protein VTK56DRAFT_3649 [Thermocarpiscus australiensis]